MLHTNKSILENEKNPKRIHRAKQKSTIESSSFITKLETNISSPLIKKRKEKQLLLDQKVKLLKETTLKDYKYRNKNLNKKSEKLIDFSKYINHSFIPEKNIHQKSCITPKSPMNKSYGTNTVKTTPIKKKKLVKTRF